MEYVKSAIKELSYDELRANVKVCLEHSYSIFLGNYQGLSQKEEDYMKNKLNLEGEIIDSDLEFKEILEVFQETMKKQSLYNLSPAKNINPLTFVILGVIQAFELSEVPTIMPPVMEALVTGRWKNFVLNSAGLMSPSGMKLEVLGQIVMYLISLQGYDDFLEWCKNEVSKESFNFYTNQTMDPLEELLGETPET